MLWPGIELLPNRAAESIPVEDGMGEVDLLASSLAGLESEIENDTVIVVVVVFKIGPPDTGSWKKKLS